ncbi:MAG: flagellar biosynthesis protein FlgN [Spirochaetaceae bacterium]|jgi:hypothetical protein|nr:flagellar biosynthesis protein FlgN [Spirochaetaceae bacterium]
MEELSGAEVEQRVAVLKRFRALLTMQRDRFRVYLETLDHQKNLIEKGSAEELCAHVELEERIVGDIISIQKTIEPMRALYEFTWKGGGSLSVPEIPKIEETITNLKTEAGLRWERNKALLEERMSAIRTELSELRASPYRRRRSSYPNAPAPSMIDIKG